MDVKEKVKSIIADQLEIDMDKLTMETTFEEIDADSLDIVELVMTLEEEFDLEISDEEIENIKRTRGEHIVHGLVMRGICAPRGVTGWGLVTPTAPASSRDTTGQGISGCFDVTGHPRKIAGEVGVLTPLATLQKKPKNGRFTQFGVVAALMAWMMRVWAQPIWTGERRALVGSQWRDQTMESS